MNFKKALEGNVRSPFIIYLQTQVRELNAASFLT